MEKKPLKSMRRRRIDLFPKHATIEYRMEVKILQYQVSTASDSCAFYGSMPKWSKTTYFLLDPPRRIVYTCVMSRFIYYLFQIQNKLRWFPLFV